MVVGGFVAVYLGFLSGDSPPPLELTTEEGGAAGAGPDVAVDAAALTGTWQVVSGSEAGYRVRERLAALPAQNDAVGRTQAVTGSARLRPPAARWP